MNRERKRARDAKAPSYPPVPYDRCGACSKRRYATEGDALTVASRAAWSGAQRVYACPAGPGFHLTSQPQRKANR